MEIIISVGFFVLIGATAFVYRGVTAGRMSRHEDKK